MTSTFEPAEDGQRDLDEVEDPVAGSGAQDGRDGRDDDTATAGGTTTPPASGTAPSAVPPPQP